MSNNTRTLGCFTLPDIFMPRAEAHAQLKKGEVKFPRKTRSDKGVRRTKAHDPVVALITISQQDVGYGTTPLSEYRAARAIERFDALVLSTANLPKHERDDILDDALRDVLWRDNVTGTCRHCGCSEVNNVPCTCRRFR